MWWGKGLWGEGGLGMWSELRVMGVGHEVVGDEGGNPPWESPSWLKNTTKIRQVTFISL